MAKLLDFQNPLNGHKGNIAQPMTWIPLILGGVVLLSTFSLAQRVGASVGKKLPFVDTTPNSPWQSTAPITGATTNYIG